MTIYSLDVLLFLFGTSLAFSLILRVALTLLHSYSTDDKTSMLMVKKIIHSEGHPERFSELHGEEKREEGDRGDQEKKRRSQRGESSLANNQFCMCCPQSGIPREVHGIK